VGREIDVASRRCNSDMCVIVSWASLIKVCMVDILVLLSRYHFIIIQDWITHNFTKFSIIRRLDGGVDGEVRFKVGVGLV